MNPDRFFSPDSTIRSLARELYASAADLPIVSPRGHVDPLHDAESRLIAQSGCVGVVGGEIFACD